MAEAQLDKLVRLRRAERLTLAVMTARVKAIAGCSVRKLREVIHLAQMDVPHRLRSEGLR